ncbi:MAG TPA: dihydroorotate dehydrogenase-like protein [Ktedonobacteraceae bacterium]
MPDLTTTYLGLDLKNPLVASASPLSKKLDRVRQLEDAGAAAIVMYSLFEEQIAREADDLDCYLNLATNSYAEALSYFPDLDHYNVGPERYLEHLRKAKEAVAIPVIGSLNGVSAGGWVDYARQIEQAGADALELNIYYLPTDMELSSSALEKVYSNLVREVRGAIQIPLALKLSPFVTALPHLARRFVEAGANGMVLFNRFYQPDFDLEEGKVVPHLELSTSHELLLPLRWIALLYGRLYTDLALTSGVHRIQDVLKAIMAGANVVMLASELLQHGPARLGQLLRELDEWMEKYEYLSVAQMRGCMSQYAVAEPAAFERAHYMKALNLFDDHLPR